MTENKMIACRVTEDIYTLLKDQATEQNKTIYNYTTELLTAQALNQNAAKIAEADRLKGLENLVIELTKFCRFNANILIKIIEKARPDDFKNIIKTEKERAWPGEVPNERHN